MTDQLDTRARRAEGQSPYTPSDRKRRHLTVFEGTARAVWVGIACWIVAGLIIWIAI